MKGTAALPDEPTADPDDAVIEAMVRAARHHYGDEAGIFATAQAQAMADPGLIGIWRRVASALNPAVRSLD